MFSKITPKLTRGGAFLAVFASAVAFAFFGGQTITIDINCGQGIVDARHKIEYEIKDPNGNIKTATAYVAKSGSEQGAALSSETALDNACTGDTQRDGTSLQLPPGHTVEKVTVSKQKKDGSWQENDGHLEVLDDEGNTISNQ